ncbi:MAG: hypothetical protein ABH849_00755 [Nanoarchaeota archaeon]
MTKNEIVQSRFERKFNWYIERGLDTFRYRGKTENGLATLTIADESKSNGAIETYSFTFLIDNIYSRWGLKPSEACMESILNLREDMDSAIGKSLHGWSDRFSKIQGMYYGAHSIDADSPDPMISVGLAYTVISEPGQGRLPLSYKVRPIKEMIAGIKPTLQKRELYDWAPYCILNDYEELSEKLNKKKSF